jgi:hypothetical protein
MLTPVMACFIGYSCIIKTSAMKMCIKVDFYVYDDDRLILIKSGFIHELLNDDYAKTRLKSYGSDLNRTNQKNAFYGFTLTLVILCISFVSTISVISALTSRLAIMLLAILL